MKNEKYNQEKFNFLSAFQKKHYERNEFERLIVILSKMIAVIFIFFIVIRLMTYPLSIIKETSKDVEKRQYEAVAKEIGVNEKEIILSSKFFEPGSYTAETSKGTYIVQFDEDYNIKRIVKED